MNRKQLMSRITFPLNKGRHSKQAHADLPTGTYEREVSRNGFFGSSTQLYHTHKPVGWKSIEGDLIPRAFKLKEIEETSQCPHDARTVVFNDDGKIRYWKVSEEMSHLVINADGDELLFIQEGNGEIFCDFGNISYRDGDYVLIPRCTQWRMAPNCHTEVLMIEATGESFYLPEKGITGYHSIFDRSMIVTAEINDKFLAQHSEKQTIVKIKRNNRITAVQYPYNPLDAVGWHGEVSVLRINWRDIRPIVSHRYNLPPSVHFTFITAKFDIATLTPRPIESDPGALKVPFFHTNADEDEFMFHHKGQSFARDEMIPGYAILHPIGIVHGPQPGAFKIGEKSQRKYTDEVVIKIDFKNALSIGDIDLKIEDTKYQYCWTEEN